jgi:membrane protease YdiL (CAAX protease family)
MLMAIIPDFPGKGVNLMIEAQVSPSGFSLTQWIRQHPFLALVLLVFLFEWIVLVPGAAGEIGLLPFKLPEILGFVAGWGPGLAAAIVVVALNGKAGIKNLFRRYLIWRVSIGWYLVALFGTAFFILGGIGLHVLLGGEVPNLPAAGITPLDLAFTFLIFIVFGFIGNLEDVAWRGVALPLLQYRYSALRASLMIGVLEGLTHLPYFFVPGDFRNQVGIWFMVFTIAIVILMTWMFNNTRGSLLIVVLYHAAQNAWANLLDTTPPPGPNDLQPFIFAAVLMCVAAITVVGIYGPRRLSRKPASEMPEL